MPRERYRLWIGRNDNVMPPENVQLRIVERHKGCCAECQSRLQIGRWHLDHVIPLQDGGVNAERNLQPLCVACHGIKTNAEATDRAAVRRKAKAHLGIDKRAYVKQPMQSAGFVKKPKRTDQLPLPPRRLIYQRGALFPPSRSDELD